MRPEVAADLAEARRRAERRIRRNARFTIIDRDYVVQEEDEQPSGVMAVVGAVLLGLAATAAVTWSGWAPRLLGLFR